jgi:predicted lactoylglutathione lyase
MIRAHEFQESAMNEDAFNMSMRKFLKVVGVTSQQEIEKAVRGAVEKGELKGNETLSAEMVLTIGQVSLRHKVDGTIELG